MNQKRKDDVKKEPDFIYTAKILASFRLTDACLYLMLDQ